MDIKVFSKSLLLIAALGWAWFLGASNNLASGDIRDAGQPAPPIDLQKILQAPNDTTATLKCLNGKVVVIEFWATWCPSCIKAIPHFNKLVDTLKGAPVVFIAVTDEDEATVKRFLAQTPIHGWIGLNSSGSMIKSYGIGTGDQKVDSGRPLTVVIRPDGIVDARARPWAMPFPITAQNLLNLAAGKPSGLISSRIVFAGKVHDISGHPVAGARVTATESISNDELAWIGDVITDREGRFKIDLEYPISYFSSHPILLKVAKAGYADCSIQDMRGLSSEKQRDLHIEMSPADQR